MQPNIQPNIFKQVFIRIFLRLVTAFACLCLVISLSGCEQKISKVLASPPGDWVAIRGEGVALSLPMGFIGGNPGRELTDIQAQLGAIDPDSEKKLRAVSQNPTAVALVAFDTQVNDPQGNQASSPKIPAATNVNITSQSLPKDAKAQSLLKMGVQQITNSSSNSLGGYQILQQQVITIQEQEIVKIIATIATSKPTAKVDVNSGLGINPVTNPVTNSTISTTSTTTSATTGANTMVTSTASAIAQTPETQDNLQIQQLFYLVPDADHKKLWVITYTTLAQGFDRYLPIFEKSINTLQIFS